jgi:hypothetical protein
VYLQALIELPTDSALCFFVAAVVFFVQATRDLQPTREQHIHNS